MRVAKRVKNKNSNIKTVHYIAPKVWIWRKGRVKKLKNFVDHILLLFKFEKPYFEKEQVSCEFVGHPLLEKNVKYLDEQYRIGNAIISDKAFDQLERNLLRTDPQCDYFNQRSNLLLPSLAKAVSYTHLRAHET